MSDLQSVTHTLTQSHTQSFFIVSMLRSLLEIEIKFRLGARGRELLMERCGRIAKSQVLHDIYVDQSDATLARQDMWLRSRNGAWELKSPMVMAAVGESSPRVDAYREMCAEDEIKTELMRALQIRKDTRNNTRSLVSWMHSHALACFASIRTQRDTFELPLRDDGVRVRVDVDRCDFFEAPRSLLALASQEKKKEGSQEDSDRHILSSTSIAEVEVMLSEGGDRAHAESIVTELARELGEPSAPHESVQPKGKVLQYISEYVPATWRALDECGLLQAKGVKA